MELPVSTILRILVTALLVAVLIKLSSFLVLLFLAIIIAVALSPAVDWLKAKGVPEWAAHSLTALSLVVGVLLIAFGLIPSVMQQVTHLMEKLPELKTELENSVHGVGLHEQVHAMLEHPEGIIGNLNEKYTAWGGAALGGMYSFGLLIILSIYFLIDGDKAYQWVVAFFNPANQKKLKKTAEEIRPIIFAYVMGQLITCCLVAIYVLIVLRILHVPGALLLAVIAAICDIVPVVGFITSLVVGFLMSLTVSLSTALTVGLFYLGYTLLENYLIAPRVYGKKMDLSKLAVLLSILIGGVLAGVPGMIIVLPIVASYPAIEKIWLKHYVGEDTVKVHEQQTGV